MKKRTSLLMLGILFYASPCLGHPIEAWGFGATASALAGAQSASPDEVDAVFYNPAATRPAQPVVMKAGLLWAQNRLTVNGEDAAIPSLLIYHLGLAAQLPVGEWLGQRLGVAFLLMLPHEGIYSIQQPDDETPTFAFWDGRNRRLVLAAASSLELTEWLAVGVGLSLLPNVDGAVSVDLVGGDEHSTHVKVDYNLAPSLGLRFSPYDWLTWGMNWQGGHTSYLKMPVDVEVAPGVAPVSARVFAPAYSSPDKLTLGINAQLLTMVTASCDLSWYRYSEFNYASPDVILLDESGGLIQESYKDSIDFKDVFTLRSGIEWELDWASARAGYAFIPSPVPAQTRLANLYDADRHLIALGLGVSLPERWLPSGISFLKIDGFAQAQFLDERSFEKELLIPSNPGYPNATIDGEVYSVGLDFSLAFK